MNERIKNKIIDFLSNSPFFNRIAFAVVSKSLSNGKNMNPQYLIDKKWVCDENGFYYEPYTKERDRIWVKFESNFYRVYHGPNKTFIALRSKVLWFENYSNLINS